MLPLIFAAFAAAIGFTVGRGTKVKNSTVSSGLVWNPDGYWEREQATTAPQSMGRAVSILMQLVSQRMPVSPGLAQAAYAEAMQMGDVVTAQQIAIVFLRPQQQPQFQPPPIVIGEEDEAALQETYGQADAVDATSTTTFHNQAAPVAPSVSDVSPDEWREFLLCFKTKDAGYKGERHIGAFEHASRRLAQLGVDPSSLTSEEAQYSALDKDLSNYLQTSERLLNDFTGESINVNGEKVPVTRSGVLSLLKAAGPAGAKGWLTEEQQRKSFPTTTEIFKRGNGRF